MPTWRINSVEENSIFAGHVYTQFLFETPEEAFTSKFKLQEFTNVDLNSPIDTLLVIKYETKKLRLVLTVNKELVAALLSKEGIYQNNGYNFICRYETAESMWPTPRVPNKINNSVIEHFEVPLILNQIHQLAPFSISMKQALIDLLNIAPECCSALALPKEHSLVHHAAFWIGNHRELVPTLLMQEPDGTTTQPPPEIVELVEYYSAACDAGRKL